MGILMLKKIRSCKRCDMDFFEPMHRNKPNITYLLACKSFGGLVKLGFFMWLPVLQSGKAPKLFPMSVNGCKNDRSELSVQIREQA